MSSIDQIGDVAVDLARSPLGLIGITLSGYQAGRRLQERFGGHALLQPVLIALAGACIPIPVL